MPTIFQIYTTSADAPPGKGVGESLAPDADFKELRAVAGWRRILAATDQAVAVGTPAAEILRLTGDAEIWYAKPRAAKVRWTVLEGLRESLAKQKAPEVTTDMEAPVAASKKKVRAKKSGGAGNEPEGAANGPEGAANGPEGAANGPEGADADTPAAPAAAQSPITDAPEGQVISGLLEASAPTDVAVPDLDAPDKQETAIRFCPVCRYYLYLQISGEDQSLSRLCRNCGHHEKDEKGGLVMEMMIQERAAESYKILLNEFTRQDPRLPHIRKNIKCPDPACDSNHGKAEPDVIYIKYDAVNLLYLYICDICGHQWRSGR